jgi:AraC-like DNA-binding protein
MAPKAKPLPIPVTDPHRRGAKGIAARIRRIKVENPELGATKIAKLVGCNPSNVTRVLQKFLGNSSETDLQDYQNQKAKIFDALQKRIHESISDDDIAKAQLLPRVTAAAILEDKARTIRGQATQINVSVLLDAVQTIRAMRADKPQAEDTIDV